MIVTITDTKVTVQY